MRNIGVRAGLAATGMPNPKMPKGQAGDALLGAGVLFVLICAFPQIAVIIAAVVLLALLRKS